MSTVREGMAAGEASDGEPPALDPAVANDSHVGVLAAGGEVFALPEAESLQDRREKLFVEGQQRPCKALASGRRAHDRAVPVAASSEAVLKRA